MTINPVVADVSHYDDILPHGFEKARAWGLWGIIHKSSEGTGIIDHNYAPRRAPALAAGLLWGAYHFIRPGNISKQVSLFLRCALPDNQVLVALDYEDGNVSLREARAFIEGVEAAIGRSCVLYSGNTIKEKLGTSRDAWWGARRLWLAQYSARWTVQRSWSKPWLWQYTGDGSGPKPHTVPGISIAGGLDISSYDGTEAQLKSEWAGAVPEPVPAPVPGPTPPIPPPTPAPSWQSSWGPQTGKASWYGDSQNADGSRVNNLTDMTAAHLHLPFGTQVKVTRTDTGLSVIVTIHDRGPYVSNRIIDLRPAAARALDMIDDGVIPVKLEIVPAVS